MNKMPIEAVERLQKNMPDFFEWVEAYRPGEKVEVLFDDFEGEPEKLHDCIWYALSKGRSVAVVLEYWRGVPHQ